MSESDRYEQTKSGRKRHLIEQARGREIDYETPTVEFETPMRENPQPPGSFDAGYCWCGKRVPGCKGNPSIVRKIDAVTTVYVCPHGRDETSIDKKLFEAAKKAGLVS